MLQTFNTKYVVYNSSFTFRSFLKAQIYINLLYFFYFSLLNVIYESSRKIIFCSAQVARITCSAAVLKPLHLPYLNFIFSLRNV